MAREWIKGKFTEEMLERAVISLFEEEGYTYVLGSDIHRRREEILLKEDMEAYLSARYPELSATDRAQVFSRLDLVTETPLYQGNREAYHLVSEGFNLPREEEGKVALHVDYIDFDHPDRNIFKVVNQYSVEDADSRRPDILVFINGIPVSIWEMKTAIEEGTTVYDAWEQITVRYARDLPRLLRYSFLAVICDGANTRMGSVFTPYEYYYAWNKVHDGETVRNGIGALFSMVKGVFAKDRILRILRDFILYPDEGGKETAIICRYPQFFGAEKMLSHIRSHIRPRGDGKGGTYFGATGCGKTYLMLFLTRLLCHRYGAQFRNPTVIILVDRDDLDTQAAERFEAAIHFLYERDVRSIESREDLRETLKGRPSGGVYVVTVQKFCEEIGLLSDRTNIICLSDEAHRTQLGVTGKLKKTEAGIAETYGFGYYLRKSFPNATYCGFTGTPIDETVAVFGPLVDSYTMKESCEDGITVRIVYEPRLVRVMLSDEEAKKIQAYYEECEKEGSTPEQVEASKRAMSRMKAILGHPDRIRLLAEDMVRHYEVLCREKPGVLQKAMVVSSDRELAFQLLQAVLRIRPEWGKAKKAEDESRLSEAEKEELEALPKINLVATRGANDPKPLYEACGTKEHRKMLERQFKNDQSNFQIAIVVDMWVTGFDVPSLSVMYIDKPLQKHTLIQTISRVNRVFKGKDRGLVVDYIGIYHDMMEALKRYGGKQESPVDSIKTSLEVFRNEMSILADIMYGFDMSRLDRSRLGNGHAELRYLMALNEAAEFVQEKKERENQFMGHSRRMKNAYALCAASGGLSEEETWLAQCYMEVRSIIYKTTEGNAPDADMMNRTVENMVQKAISCTGIESVINASSKMDIFSDEFVEKLKSIKLPITKFQALLKLLQKEINEYRRINRVKAIAFDKRLRKIVDQYNDRDHLEFSSGSVSDLVDSLAEELRHTLGDLEKDKKSFKELGLSYEEKAFYDILIEVRDAHGLSDSNEKCKMLAKEIKKIVEEKSRYADWDRREDTKNQLNTDMMVLLYKNQFGAWEDPNLFKQVLAQAELLEKDDSSLAEEGSTYVHGVLKQGTHLLAAESTSGHHEVQ